MWLQELSKWLIGNKLELNVKKTKCVIFRAKNKQLDFAPVLLFRESILEVVPSIRFLGVIFNNALSWNDHVNHICTKLSRSVGILWKLQCLLPCWLKKQLYFALVQSILHYCLLIWGNTTNSNLNALLVLQKKAIRAIANLSYRDSTKQQWRSLGILKIHDLVNLRRAQDIHHIFYEHPNLFPNLESSPQTAYPLRKQHYRKPRIRTNYGIQLKQYQVIDFLNNNEEIEALIKEFKSIKLFKKHLLQVLLQRYTQFSMC